MKTCFFPLNAEFRLPIYIMDRHTAYMYIQDVYAINTLCEIFHIVYLGVYRLYVYPGCVCMKVYHVKYFTYMTYSYGGYVYLCCERAFVFRRLPPLRGR